MPARVCGVTPFTLNRRYRTVRAEMPKKARDMDIAPRARPKRGRGVGPPAADQFTQGHGP